MEKNLKDIIANYKGSDNKKGQDDSCYQGLFWDLETRKFLRWNELRKERKSTESKGSE
tara:strand:+ start:57 stop:230 length:174 start_codon:yes stop_codon:yes gene_type:complete